MSREYRHIYNEGVSLHYMPPSRYAHGSTSLTAALTSASHMIDHAVHTGPVWTTTAHFRQSLPRLEAFRAEGCIAVNNEAAPAFAVGWRRQVDIAVLLGIADSLANGRFLVPEECQPRQGSESASDMLDLVLDALVRFDDSK